MLKDIKPQIKTITIEGKPYKIRYDMNALDYLERTFGSIDKAFANGSILGQKHTIRAALLCNFEENKSLLDENSLDRLVPSLSQVGEWFDIDTMKAVATELYNTALEQMSNEGENCLGENIAPTNAAQILLTAIGALSKLYGPQSLQKALKAFGYLPQKK